VRPPVSTALIGIQQFGGGIFVRHKDVAQAGKKTSANDCDLVHSARSQNAVYTHYHRWRWISRNHIVDTLGQLLIAAWRRTRCSDVTKTG
jgi:hypothetical protein